MKAFMQPIPGQALTATPKDAPWERPPDLVEVSDVVEHYITRMADDDIMDDMAATFEMGATIDGIVGTMLNLGAMKGVHTIQSGALAAPTIAAFIKSAMSLYGIDAKESAMSVEEKQTKRVKERVNRIVKHKLLNGAPVEDQPSPIEAISEEAPELEVDTVEEEQMSEPSMGLMAKE